MPSKEEESKRCQLVPGGFAGTFFLIYFSSLFDCFSAGTGPNGSFFEAPAWVDKSKAPGTTSQVNVKYKTLSHNRGQSLFYGSHILLYEQISDKLRICFSQEPAVAPPGWWIPLATGKFLFFR